MKRIARALGVCLLLAAPTIAHAQEDPEDEKGYALWLDQGFSKAISGNRSVDVEFHERFDDGASHLYEYFVQGGMTFRLQPWLSIAPIYRYQRFPDAETSYENRLILNVTMSATEGTLRPTFRFLAEGRFPEDRDASARLRFRPGFDYTLPMQTSRPPVLVVSDEFFIVPGNNSFSAGGRFTQNRFQVGVRVRVSEQVVVRPYFMLQSLNRADGWETHDVFGLSVACRF